MKAVRLTLICHALTHAQKTGRFALADDPVLGDAPLLKAVPDGVQVLSAPEPRARETAAWLTPEVRIETALADCDMGHWQGFTLKQLQREQSDALAWWQVDVEAAPHGGESFAALHKRVADWLEAFDTPGDWWAVTHPMVMRAAMVEVLGSSLGAYQYIDVPPCSRLELSRTQVWRIRLASA
ncbi:histidine phosphatase family protein [Pseudomonas putida]|uniref:histidine phosphatase family protein n=1 Tax=Pseudomonas putida TaxID=303 RepID=UPI00383A77B1